MIFLEPVKVCLDRTSDLLGVLDREKVSNDLRIVLDLARESQCWISFLNDL